MNWNALIGVVCLASAALAPAQMMNPKGDVLGAHANSGRGCSACHAPHSAGIRNPGAPSDAAAPGMIALWGEDVTGYYEEAIRAGRDDADSLHRRQADESPDVTGLLACLSCHDGNYASPAMMRNSIYEKLPATYDTVSQTPTLFGSLGPLDGDYLSQHPVGLTATMKCGGPDAWDCFQSEGVVSMKGAKSGQFVRDYGFFVKPADYNNTAVVECTTCHDPHLMNVFTVGAGSRSGLPPGTYSTMFFLRGPYNTTSRNPHSDQAAQFCRQCHATQSNEMYGSNIATVF